jgi:hypothetical protein
MNPLQQLCLVSLVAHPRFEPWFLNNIEFLTAQEALAKYDTWSVELKKPNYYIYTAVFMISVDGWLKVLTHRGFVPTAGRIPQIPDTLIMEVADENCSPVLGNNHQAQLDH